MVPAPIVHKYTMHMIAHSGRSESELMPGQN